MGGEGGAVVALAAAVCVFGGGPNLRTTAPLQPDSVGGERMRHFGDFQHYSRFEKPATYDINEAFRYIQGLL